VTYSALTKREIAKGLQMACDEPIAIREPDIDSYIGRAIRRRRRLLGLTQAEAGARVGISYQQWQKYESAANRVSASRLVTIARALECRPCDLLPEVLR
jgi:DNA-binding Xre family transcriptional regulator